MPAFAGVPVLRDVERVLGEMSPIPLRYLVIGVLMMVVFVFTQYKL